jgi:ribokinase
MRTVICGGLRVDFVISAQGEVRLNQIGGNAVYASVGARVWAPEVIMLARTGENYPKAWLKDLAARGLLTDEVHIIPGRQEIRTFYAYTDEKTRIDHNPEAHFARLGLPLPPELEGYTYSLYETNNPQSDLVLRGSDVSSSLEGVDAVHMSPLALRSHLEMTQAFRALGAGQITVDPGEYRLTRDSTPQVRAYCAEIDAFLPSELEVSLLLGEKSPHEAAEVFASWGPPLVVVKRGPDGCLLYERDANRFTRIPAYPAQVVDVTGAGDSFGGGFAVGLRQTGDPLRAVLMGTVSASFVVEGWGALYSLDPPPAEVARRLAALEEQVKPA